MVTGIEFTQTMAIHGGVASIEFILPLASLMEKKYSGAMLLLKGYIPVDSKSLIHPLTESNVLQANPIRRAMRYRVILQAVASFLK